MNRLDESNDFLSSTLALMDLANPNKRANAMSYLMNQMEYLGLLPRAKAPYEKPERFDTKAMAILLKFLDNNKDKDDINDYFWQEILNIMMTENHPDTNNFTKLINCAIDMKFIDEKNLKLRKAGLKFIRNNYKGEPINVMDAVTQHNPE